MLRCQNTAVGSDAYAASNTTTGTNNVAVGFAAFAASTTGSNNTAVGMNSLKATSTGGNNVAMGGSALTANTTASNNTAVGNDALAANTTGTQNVAVGTATLDANTTGASNVAVGYSSLGANTTGASNTAIGMNSGVDLTTGNNNTLLGNSAGNDLTTGTQNIMIGYNVKPGGATESFQIVISTDQDSGKGASTAFIAPNGGGVFQDNNSADWATTSDARIKKNIKDNNDGLEKINQIQVRNFEYRTLDEIVDFDEPKSAVVKKEGIQLGVIAQEIEEILPNAVTEESTGVKTVNPDNLKWYLVNAVKELSTQVDELKQELKTLKGE